MMVRSIHHLIFIRHSLWQYVDDLLILLDSGSAPIWAALVIGFIQVIAIPLSWLIRISDEKRDKMVQQLVNLKKTDPGSVQSFESIIGRWPWVTTLWKTLRPLLGPLYRWLQAISATLISMSHAHGRSCWKIIP